MTALNIRDDSRLQVNGNDGLAYARDVTRSVSYMGSYGAFDEALDS